MQNGIPVGSNFVDNVAFDRTLMDQIERSEFLKFQADMAAQAMPAVPGAPMPMVGQQQPMQPMQAQPGGGAFYSGRPMPLVGSVPGMLQPPFLGQDLSASRMASTGLAGPGDYTPSTYRTTLLIISLCYSHCCRTDRSYPRLLNGSAIQ